MSIAHDRLVRYFCDQVEEIGGEAQKIDPRGHVGRCDCFAVWHYRDGNAFYFVEVKVGTDAVKPWQEREHARLRSLGYTVEVLRDYHGVNEFISRMKLRMR